MVTEKSIEDAKKFCRDAASSTFGEGTEKMIGFYNHAERVADYVDSSEEKIVAFLHDVIEDCRFENRDILKEMINNFSYETVEAVEILTRKGDKTYFEYIIDIKKSGNRLALNVKMADIKDHLHQEDTLRPSLKIRYLKAKMILKDV